MPLVLACRDRNRRRSAAFALTTPGTPMPAGGEEHRDRQPRRPGRLDHHLQPGARAAPRPTPRPRPRPGSATVGRARRRQTSPPRPSSTRTVCALAMPRSIPTSRLSSSSSPPRGRRSVPPAGHDERRTASGHGPKETTRPTDGSHSCAANGPDLDGPTHFPHPGHPWPGQRWQSDQRDPASQRPPQSRYSTPPTGPAGMLMQPWNHRARSSTGGSLHEPRAHSAERLPGKPRSGRETPWTWL